MKTMKGAQNTRLRKRGVAVKRAIASILLSLGMAVGMVTPAFASSLGIYFTTLTTAKASATFNYGTAGKQLTITVSVNEQHSQIPEYTHSDSKSDTVNGNYTSVGVTVSAIDGYEIVNATATGYVNRIEYATTGKLTP